MVPRPDQMASSRRAAVLAGTLAAAGVAWLAVSHLLASGAFAGPAGLALDLGIDAVTALLLAGSAGVLLRARRMRAEREQAALRAAGDRLEAAFEGRVAEVRRAAAIEKLDAVGTLAAGVARDFNNLLTIIRGYSEIHLQGHAAGDPGREDLEEIGRAADRAAELVRELMIEAAAADLDAAFVAARTGSAPGPHAVLAVAGTGADRDAPAPDRSPD